MALVLVAELAQDRRGFVRMGHEDGFELSFAEVNDRRRGQNDRAHAGRRPVIQIDPNIGGLAETIDRSVARFRIAPSKPLAT